MTALLLDSNALIWWMLDRDVLSGEARRSMLAPDASLSVSVASLWELEIKRQRGRLALDPSIWDDLAPGAIALLSIDARDALAAARLPPHHRDPFDRMIIAQALNRGLAVVTSDQSFERYGVPVLRA